ncbi:MAG: Gfo/Idh/MocA family oxidoreductase [Phycisphaerae bacterium]|nr:Gfo/Idh/MocA family oxidoreductase [Phycisphaerae bacterium]
MGSESLTAAILGLNDGGQRLLEAAASTGCFQIKAVADLDPQKAEKAAAEHHCDAYSDYRQLIVQNQVDCLLVAAEAYTCDEQLKGAIHKKLNVLKLAPPARTFAETLEYVRMAESEGVQFAVANPARFQSSFMAAQEMISQGRIEHPFLISASCSFGAADRSGWRADPTLAGGGVLLYDCYPLIDQLLSSFSLPEQVYALKTNQAPDKQQRLCLTEDTALVSMRFTDALMGSIVATRRNDVGPHRVSIEIHANQARLTVTRDQVELRTQDGRNDLKWQYDEDEQVVAGRLLTSFAKGLRAPQEHPFAGGGAESLRTMAVLEAAYLSAKTGFPEEPARILRLGGAPPMQNAAVGGPGPARAGTSV